MAKWPAASGLKATGRYVKCLPWAACSLPALPGRGPYPALRAGIAHAAWLSKVSVSVSALRAVFVSQRPLAVSWLLAPRPPLPRSLRSHRPRPGPSAPPRGAPSRARVSPAFRASVVRVCPVRRALRSRRVVLGRGCAPAPAHAGAVLLPQISAIAPVPALARFARVLS